MSENLKAENNKKQFRFEIALENGEVATLEYRWLKGNMVLMRTLVPASMRGKGIGASLVRQVLEHARSAGLKVIVYCPFITKYLESHAEYAGLVAPADAR
jgi:predicted GNAT family acetyltransferase